MSITGTFGADFSAFKSETQAARAELKAFAGASDQANESLSRMTQGMTAAGRTSGESITMIAGMSEAGTRAAAAMSAHAAATTRVGAASSAAQQPISGLHDSLADVDHVLGAMGLHIVPEVRALGQLGEASGKTASQLGAVSTAGLVLGAAIGGWQLGRVIAEFTGTDAIIGKATSTLLGWGSVADQVAGANADALARASALVGFKVTDMTQALVINGAHLGPWRSQVAQSAAVVGGWQAELAKVRSSGDLPQLTKDLASNNFELKDLAARYHVTVEALQFFTRETANATAAEAAASAVTQASNARKLKELGEEMTAHKAARELAAQAALGAAKLQDEADALRVKNSGTVTDAMIADVRKWEKDTIAAAVEAGKATGAFYSSLASDVHEKLAGIGSHWTEIVTHSKEAQQQEIDALIADYDRMIASGKTFSREVLDEQIAKIREATEAMHGYGKAAQDAATEAIHAREKANAEFMQLPDHSKDKEEKYVQTFDTVEDVNKATGLTPAVREQLLAYFAAKKAAPSGVAPGGTDTTPTVRPPAVTSSAVAPPPPASAGRGGSIVVNMNVNGTAADVARKLEQELIRSAKLKRLVGGR